MPSGVTWQLNPQGKPILDGNGKKIPVKPSGTPLKLSSPANPNADPSSLTGSYKAWVKAHPGTKVKKTAVQKWLESTTPSKTPALPFDPTANFPTAPTLTAYPDLEDLPDGSSVPDTPAAAFKRTSASLLDPKKFADLEGMKAFQPVIDALTGQQNRLGAGVADANNMIDKSYGDAAAGSLKGAQIVADTNAKSNQSLTDLAARMAQAAGGDPTAAAAVGQTTANQIGADKDLAGIAAQGQADQAAAATRDAGTAKLAYKGATDSAIANLATQLASAKQGGSQAQGKALEEAMGFNDSQRTSALNRDVSSQEAWLAGQLAGPQITAGKLANVGTRATLTGNANNQKVNKWSALNTQQQQQYTAAVTRLTDKATAAQLKQAMQKGLTPVPELALADNAAYGALKTDLDQAFTTQKNGPVANPGVIYHQAINQLHTAYPSSSAKTIKALATRYAQSQMTMWNSQHSKGSGDWKMVNGAPALVKT